MTTPFARYLNIREAYGPSFSPDGNRVSFLTNITGVPQVWVVGVSRGWPDQITFYDERISQAHFSHAADHLVFSRDIGGNENAQIYLINGVFVDSSQKLVYSIHNITSSQLRI